MLYPGRYVIEGGQTSTGSIIAWLGRMMNGTMDMEALNRKAAALEPGRTDFWCKTIFRAIARLILMPCRVGQLSV